MLMPPPVDPDANAKRLAALQLRWDREEARFDEYLDALALAVHDIPRFPASSGQRARMRTIAAELLRRAHDA